jgi:hypothetical protein
MSTSKSDQHLDHGSAQRRPRQPVGTGKESDDGVKVAEGGVGREPSFEIMFSAARMIAPEETWRSVLG